MIITSMQPSVKSQATLAVLQRTIAKTLDTKQRLGQYVVVWQDGRPVLTGADAPIQEGVAYGAGPNAG